MANSVSLMYWNDRLQNAQPRVTDLLYSITAAKTVTDLLRSPVYSVFDAIAAQATIDNFLGTTNEFLIAQFDATAMGTDAFAGIVNMSGQCAEVYAYKISTYTGTGGSTIVDRFVEDVATLTSSSLSTQIAKGANGNVAFRAVLTGVDALTSGEIHAQIYWRSK